MSACSRRVLQFDHRDGQAVDEAHQIGPARLLAALHRELVHHQKAVVLALLEVDQPHAVVALRPRAIPPPHLQEQPVEGAVVLDQRQRLGFGDGQGVLPPGRRRECAG